MLACIKNWLVPPEHVKETKDAIEATAIVVVLFAPALVAMHVGALAVGLALDVTAVVAILFTCYVWRPTWLESV